MMDQVHGRPDGTGRRNFNVHKARMVEGRHFYSVDHPNEIRSLGLSRADGSTPASVTALTERGYLVLVKSFTDDLAWRVQEQLVDGYFRAKAAPATQHAMSPELAGQVQQMVTGMLTGVVTEVVVAVVRNLLPELVEADLSKQRTVWARGKTSGELLDIHGIKNAPRGMAQSYSFLLDRSGCMTGRGELGKGKAKVFDQEKASVLWKKGQRDWANRYLQDRSGQMSLALVARAFKVPEKLED